MLKDNPESGKPNRHDNHTHTHTGDNGDDSCSMEMAATLVDYSVCMGGCALSCFQGCTCRAVGYNFCYQDDGGWRHQAPATTTHAASYIRKNRSHWAHWDVASRTSVDKIKKGKVKAYETNTQSYTVQSAIVKYELHHNIEKKNIQTQTPTMFR